MVVVAGAAAGGQGPTAEGVGGRRGRGYRWQRVGCSWASGYSRAGRWASVRGGECGPPRFRVGCKIKKWLTLIYIYIILNIL